MVKVTKVQRETKVKYRSVKILILHKMLVIKQGKFTVAKNKEQPHILLPGTMSTIEVSKSLYGVTVKGLRSAKE